MAHLSDALARWMPRLIAAYRQARRTSGPSDRLTPAELSEVGAGVRRLSEGLTRQRRLVGAGYMDDPVLLGAYLLYFWPVSYAQGFEVLGELDGKFRTALDLGSGPGPLAIAALDRGAREVMALDRSQRALRLADQLAAGVDRGLATRTWDPEAGEPLPGGGQAWSLITVGHALNELWSHQPNRIERRIALARELAGRLRKGGALVVVEPALRTTTRELLAVRDGLVAAGHAVRAPCLFRGPCPALVKEVDWCHAERGWKPPPALAEIIAAAGLHKEALKMAYLVVRPAGEPWPDPPSGTVFRVVSERFFGHDRQRLLGCGPSGRLTVARNDTARSDANAPFDTLTRGDLFRLHDAAPSAESGGLRIKAETRVEPLALAGTPVAASRP